ncbi:MAG: S41 family peptidase [Planctomycetota bacterium]|nr:S41 family peptidase [Planctomycetota bacterium]
MNHLSDLRQGLILTRALAGALVLALSSVSLAQGDAQAEVRQAAPALVEWSKSLWQQARAGRSDRALELLRAIPRKQDADSVALASAVERYESNIARRESDRAQRLSELQVELDTHVAAGEILPALKSVLEWHTLALDKEKVLSDPRVRQLVDKAHNDAEDAEQASRWLDAHALYNHLNVLFEESRTYEADLRRLNQRLVMLRLYTPERLYAMRNAQRVAEGEDPLPPFNKVGEDWHEKLEGVDETILMRSLSYAASEHVDHVPMASMLLGGFRAVRVLATTDDLAEAFPGLADAPARDRFVATLDAEIARILERQDKADYGDLRQGVTAMLRASADTVKISREALVHEFTNGAMAELDEFSAVIWPDELAQFQRTTEGSFKGVGVQISLNDALEIRVVSPVEGTPAARAGIRPGDLIRKVDGDSTLGMSLSQAVERITGPVGTPVKLTIERPGAPDPIEFELRREEIPIYSVKGWLRTGAKETDWDWFVDPSNRIGYVRLTQFTNKTTQELRAALAAMREQQVQGLILDLRNNPGGLLTEAVGVASLFITDGTIVTQEDNKGQVRERQRAVSGPRVGQLPVVVLVNGGSASASEIVAGALQDYGRAVIVGDRSFGKGSVQNVFMMGPAAAFKLTTQYYRLPGKEGQPGRLIHRRPNSKVWGIEPDVNVEVLPKQFGEAFELRQNADVLGFNDQGELVPKPDRPDVSRLLTEGLDPQLETAILLLQSQIIPASLGKTAEAK